MRVLLKFAFFAAASLPAFAEETMHDLDAVNDAFNAGIATQNVSGLMELYGEEVMWIAPGTPMTLKGREEAEKLFTFMTSHKAEVTHDLDHSFVSDDGTLAVMIGDVFAKAEAIGVDAAGTYLYVLNKEAGDWKIVADMWNQHTQE